FGFGTGSGLPSSVAARVPDGTVTSQPQTGNFASLTFPKACSGLDRTVMFTVAPSNVTAGQLVSSVIARALAMPSGPSWTHCARTFAAAPGGCEHDENAESYRGQRDRAFRSFRHS